MIRSKEKVILVYECCWHLLHFRRSNQMQTSSDTMCAHSLKIFMFSCSNLLSNAWEYYEGCVNPSLLFKQQKILCCFMTKRNFGWQRSHHNSTLSIKLGSVSKQIRKLYRISCNINFKYIWCISNIQIYCLTPYFVGEKYKKCLLLANI